METVQRMRAKGNPKKNRRNSGSSRESLKTINLPNNLQTAFPLLIANSQHAQRKIVFGSGLVMMKGAKSEPKTQEPKTTLKFESPRLDLEDDKVFPAGIQVENLTNPQERWQAVKEQAGYHQQDGSVLRLRPNIHTPKVLQFGMPPQAAARVRELHFQLNGDTLPAWMDAISNTFHNLEHLYMTNQEPTVTEEYKKAKEVEESVTRTTLPAPPPMVTRILMSTPRRRKRQEKEMLLKQQQQDEEQDEARKEEEHLNRLKRLYIIYRLPNLISIDGVRLSAAERRLARPHDPNGDTVDHSEWVHDENADIKISHAQEGEPECVELDALHQVRTEGSVVVETAITTETHRETAVEVDIAGKFLEVALDAKTPRNSNNHQEMAEEQRCIAFDNPLHCGQMVLHESTSMAMDDCQWTAACGLAPMFREPSVNLGQPALERPRQSFRKSSSWKDCRTVIPAKALLSPRYPRSGRMTPRKLATMIEERASGVESEVLEREGPPPPAKVALPPLPPHCPADPPGIRNNTPKNYVRTSSDPVSQEKNTVGHSQLGRRSFLRMGRVSPKGSARGRSHSPAKSSASYSSMASSKVSNMSMTTKVSQASSMITNLATAPVDKRRGSVSRSCDSSSSPLQSRVKIPLLDPVDSTSLKVSTTEDTDGSGYAEGCPEETERLGPSSSRSRVPPTPSNASYCGTEAADSAFSEGARTPSPPASSSVGKPPTFLETPVSSVAGRPPAFVSEMEKKRGLPPTAPPTVSRSLPLMKLPSPRLRRKKKRGSFCGEWKDPQAAASRSSSILDAEETDDENFEDYYSLSSMASETEVEIEIQPNKED